MAGTSVTTILACDIVESTALMTRLGDDAADALRRTLFARWRAAIEAEGGTVVKTIGDAIMAVFTASAVGAVVAAERLYRAAADVDGVAVRVRVGIATGEAAEDDGDWFGTPVVEAFRLCARAEPGEILLGAATRRVVGSRGGLEFNEIGPMTLKGLPDPIVVYALSYEGAPAARRTSARRGPRRVVLGVGLAVVAMAVAAVVATRDSSQGTTGPDRAALLERLDYLPQLSRRPCTADERLGDATVVCSTLTVPEDRTAPDGRSVRLAVVKAPAADPEAPPQVSLVGSTAAVAASDQRTVADQYVVGVRGEGASRPSLECDEEVAGRRARLSLPSDVARRRRAEALDRCARQVATRGISLGHYGPDDVADDVRDLALAAGIDRFDVRMYGERGATLAAALSRQAPGLLRAAMLTSPVPPNASRFEYASRAEGALRTLAQVCAADTTCAGISPDLVGDATRLTGELSSAPRPVATSAPDGSAVTVFVDADRAAQAMWLAFHDDAVYGLVPGTISHRDYDQIGAYLALQELGPQSVDRGIVSVIWACRHASDESRASLQATRAAFPRWAGLVDIELLDLCEGWHLDPDPEVRRPPAVQRPALLVYGSLEPDARDISRLRETFRGAQVLPLRARVSGDRSVWPACVAPLRARFSVHPTEPVPGVKCGRTTSAVEFSAPAR